MAQELFTISQAAKKIGISRPTLYVYLKQIQYQPLKIAGLPLLSAEQVKQIKAERRAKKNGHRKAAK